MSDYDILSMMSSAENVRTIPIPWLRTLQIVQIQKAQLMAPEFFIQAVEGLDALMVDEIPIKNNPVSLDDRYWGPLTVKEQELSTRRTNWKVVPELYAEYCREKYKELIKLIVATQSKRMIGSVKKQFNKNEVPVEGVLDGDAPTT